MKIQAVFASRDPSRAAVLLESLTRNGFSVATAHRSKEVAAMLSSRAVSMLLLGQELTDMDGLQLLKALRSRAATKSLAVVGVLDSIQARMAAAAAPQHMAATATAAPPAGNRAGQMRLAFFNAGADECLSLDQDPAECLARVRAVLRRSHSETADEVVNMGEIRLNLTSYTLEVAGKPVPLTSKELDLLYVFIISPNRVLSRPYLIERVWGYDYFGSPRTVDVHVRRLRQKLGKAARFIQTVPCVGYKMNPEARR